MARLPAPEVEMRPVLARWKSPAIQRTPGIALLSMKERLSVRAAGYPSHRSDATKLNNPGKFVMGTEFKITLKTAWLVSNPFLSQSICARDKYWALDELRVDGRRSDRPSSTKKSAVLPQL